MPALADVQPRGAKRRKETTDTEAKKMYPGGRWGGPVPRGAAETTYP